MTPKKSITCDKMYTYSEARQKLGLSPTTHFSVERYPEICDYSEGGMVSGLWLLYRILKKRSKFVKSFWFRENRRIEFRVHNK